MFIKRMWAFLLVSLAIQCMFTTTAFAFDEGVQPRFSDFSSLYAGLYDSGNGIYVIEGSAVAPNASKRVQITLTLEKQKETKAQWCPAVHGLHLAWLQHKSVPDVRCPRGHIRLTPMQKCTSVTLFWRQLMHTAMSTSQTEYNHRDFKESGGPP